MTQIPPSVQTPPPQVQDKTLPQVIPSVLTSCPDPLAYTAARALALEKFLSGTTSIPIIRPNNAVGLTLSTGTAYGVYGAWVEFAAANDLAAHMCIGATTEGATPGNSAQIQIGTGAAGSEVVIANIPWPGQAGAGSGSPVYFPVGLFIPANSRVACRITGNVNGGTGVLKLMFIPRPLA